MNRHGDLEDYNKTATKIKKNFKGEQVREEKKKETEEIEEIKREGIVFETYKADKIMIDQFCGELKKLKLSLDKFYRLGDDTMSKRITTRQFVDQISHLGIKYSEEKKKKLMLVFNEDFNDEITYEEFIETGEAYGAELLIDLPYSYVSVGKRSLIKLVKKMNK